MSKSARKQARRRDRAKLKKKEYRIQRNALREGQRTKRKQKAEAKSIVPGFRHKTIKKAEKVKQQAPTLLTRISKLFKREASSDKPRKRDEILP